MRMPGAPQLAQLVHCAVLPPSCCGRICHQKQNKTKQTANKFRKNSAGNPLGKFRPLKQTHKNTLEFVLCLPAMNTKNIN